MQRRAFLATTAVVAAVLAARVPREAEAASPALLPLPPPDLKTDPDMLPIMSCVSRSTLRRLSKNVSAVSRVARTPRRPSDALSQAERAAVLEALNSERFADLAAPQVSCSSFMTTSISRVLHLRNLHMDLDHDVLAAYGWRDIVLDHDYRVTDEGLRFTFSEQARIEVLGRLLELTMLVTQMRSSEASRPHLKRGGQEKAGQKCALPRKTSRSFSNAELWRR